MTAEVELAPGERRDVAWRVVPRERRVRMTGEGELVAEPAAASSPRARVP